ncbi:hypothetical protein, variant 3 [Aphanomyces invadans]|uniref:Polysaccharide biosynthesis protein C-terminal domain-containing protein n=1 Tax=Aphanomyces invadans TaxID=157072 RepID=A0A024U9Y2_9STRA|nr:hypothetical protein, variant 3 [Aphanomyces invadans]ETW02702.1 hypothetical protein, variant 3 [Aphanomyces invadans]|eukprot:XP_008869307.1 hypothetical protein, variant 3 [Aphanomyces invadans]
MSSTDEKKPLLDAAITINTTASFSDLNNIQDELRQVVALALPVTATFFLEYAPGIITLLLAGHAVDPNDMQTTTLYLDAAAIAIMYMNVTGVTIGLGLATAMDTLCPQAVGGGKSLQTGVYFQAGLVVLGLVFIPIAFANAWATTILVYFGQTYTIAVLAREFATIMLVGLPFMFVYELLKKVLQAQNVVLPMMYCAVIGNCVNAVLGYALTFHTPLGFYGAAVARSVANGVLLLSLVTYIFLNKATFQACWPVAALKEVPKFVALGISGLLMMLFEWWSFELLVFIAGTAATPSSRIHTSFSPHLYDTRRSPDERDHGHWRQRNSRQRHELHLHDSLRRGNSRSNSGRECSGSGLEPPSPTDSQMRCNTGRVDGDVFRRGASHHTERIPSLFYARCRCHQSNVVRGDCDRHVPSRRRP